MTYLTCVRKPLTTSGSMNCKAGGYELEKGS